MSAREPRKKSLPMLPALFGAALALCGARSLAAPPAVPTQHNDNARTGANLSETILTPANVNGLQKLYTISLDANVNGQALYVPGVTIQGAVHNVLYLSTSNNTNNSPCSIYAFDADNPSSGPLWRHPFTTSAEWTTCTPVIDPSTATMYVLTKDNSDTGKTRLHAFDITTGIEKTGSPHTVAASVIGSGDGSVNGYVHFDTTHANERSGLLFLNGVVYIAFAHNTDSYPYHGWVLGYSYNGSKFALVGRFCTTPNGGDGGVWMAGDGLAADSNGNIYCTVGNGTFDINTGGKDYGMCVLKLSTPRLKVVDWFAPYDELSNSNADLDFGNAGVLGIPGTDRLFTGGTKFGSAFLLDSTNMGHFTSTPPDHVLQRFDNLMSDNNVGQTPVCWNASSEEYVYLWPRNAGLMQFQYDPSQGLFNPAGIYKQSSSLTSGGSLAVTADGSSNGILWAVGNNNTVYALDATDVTKTPLWSASLPSVGHFQFPTIVNGKAYVPTGSASVIVYGLP